MTESLPCPTPPNADSQNERDEDTLDEDPSETRKRLFESLASRRRVTVDTGGLQRLLTFVEQPSFFRESTKVTSLPQIEPSPNLPRKGSEGALARLQSFHANRSLTRVARSESNLYSSRRLSFLAAGKSAGSLGGTPIEADQATALRLRVYGSAIHGFSEDWRRNHFIFKDERGPFPYGLSANKDGARGLILVVQAMVIRHLLFASYITDTFRTSYLRPNDGTRRESLVRGLADLLWLVSGPRRTVCACLPSRREYVEPSYDYRPDDITERLHLFSLRSLEETRRFFRKHLETFESPYQNGCILLLYSIALSRGLDQLLEDFEFDPKMSLLGDNEELTQSAISLLLTGVARPYLHNGNLVCDDDGNYLDRPMFGIQERSDIGFLCWDKCQLEDPNSGTRVGSMLRTPRYPIWLTRINGQLGLIFSTNAELCSHWRSENRFTLFYYTGLATQIKPCRLTMESSRGRSGHVSKFRTRLAAREEKKKIPGLEQCLLTKWYGARVDWNGTMPFV